MTQNQPHFPFHLHTAPFAEGLTVAHFRGREALSRPFAYDLLTLTSAPIALSDLPAVGQPATLLIGRADEDEEDNPRRVHGVLSRVRLEGAARDRDGSWMRIRLVPRLWGLKRRRTRRIFQDQSVSDVVSAILRDWQVPHRWQLDAPPAPVGYCVQYDETDFEFVSRLLAAHGIFYFFEHAAADPGTEEAIETVVFSDAARHYSALRFTGSNKTRVLKLCERDGTFRPTSAVMTFAYEKRVRPTASRLRDYDFRVPQALGEVAQTSTDDPALGSDWLLSDEFHTFSGNDAMRVNRRDARVALEQHRVDAVRANGTSDCRDLSAGSKFILNNHDVAHLNAEWVVSEISHEGRVVELVRSVQPGGTSLVYLNTFQCAPAAVPVRPARHRRPHRQAMETAVVVGPSSEEIHTDEFGRVKVQFHWDRSGNYDERSSCWVRVSQGWVGAGWGFQFIPRIGMEVLVSFVGGDTDHPVVVGCLYNGARAPSHALPSQKTRSGIRTLSSPGGSGYNEISFEDAAGEELVYLRAQRDLQEQVGRDANTSIERDASERVGQDKRVAVGANRYLSVGGDDRETVAGRRHVSVARSLETETTEQWVVRARATALVETGAQLTLKAEGGRRDEVGQDMRTTVRGGIEIAARKAATVSVGEDLSLAVAKGVSSVVGGTLELSAKEIVLRAGASVIRITDEQITLDAKKLLIRGHDEIKALGDSGMFQLKSDAVLVASSVEVASDSSTLKLDSNAMLQGSSIKLNSGGGKQNQTSNDTSSDSETKYWKFRLHKLESGDRRDHEPLRNARFVARGHGPEPYEGSSDGEGIVKVPVVYRRCTIDIEVGDSKFTVHAGALEPAEKRFGVLQRLHHLGYGSDDVEAWTDETIAVLARRFQRHHGLTETGTFSTETVDLIKSISGGQS